MKKFLIWISGLFAGAFLSCHVKEAMRAPVDDYSLLFLGIFFLATYTMDILNLRYP